MFNTSMGKTEASTILGSALLSVHRFKLGGGRTYIIKGLLLNGQVSLLFGPPNTGKSAIIACLGGHVSMGLDCGKLRVRRAAVLYVTAEDPNGIAERANPYLAESSADAAPFDILPRAIDLSNSDEITRFISEVRGYFEGTGEAALLIVIDTLSLCIGDGDENSASAMAKVIGNAQRIARTTGAHVLIAHHTSAHDRNRPRGSTALDGNADTLLMLRKAEGEHPEGIVALTMEKQRSVRKTGPIAFEIAAIDAGRDGDGDPLTLPVAIPYKADTPLFPRAAQAQGARSASADDPRPAEVLAILRGLDQACPGEWFEPRMIIQRTGAAFAEVRPCRWSQDAIPWPTIDGAPTRAALAACPATTPVRDKCAERQTCGEDERERSPGTAGPFVVGLCLAHLDGGRVRSRAGCV